jgi:alpha-mannosidase
MKSVLKMKSTTVSLLLLLFCGALFFTSRATAQRGQGDDAKAVALLPPADQTIVKRLATLQQLPDGAWKAHEGDIPHGEAVDLDDSSWQTPKMGDRFSTEAVWFRQTIVVPQTLNGYDLTGTRVWFQFNTRGRDQTTILYFNGRRVALGDDLEPMVLFDNAHAGDKVVVAVKLLETTGPKMFRGARLRIDFSEGRPNPDDLRQEFLSAAYLLPSLAPGDTAKEELLHSAIGTVDLGALDAHDQSTFDASLKAAGAKLEALRPLFQQVTAHLTGNSHIDAAWLWPWTETVDVVHRTFGTALQLMNEYPNYTYTQSAAQYNEWMAQKYPAMNDEIAKRIKEGRWEVVGGMWVEPDLNLPDGESLVRQLLVGKRWFQKAYGVDVRIGWNPDSFGYSWQLPQIYKKSGVDYFVTQKMSWNDTNQLPFKLFWWESPDGSKVLAYFPDGYGNTQLNPVHYAKDIAIARQQAPGLNSIMDLYGVGDHGGGPTRSVLDEGFHWASPTADGTPRVTPKYEFGTAINYFTTVEKQIAPTSPTWDYTSIARGYTPPPAVDGSVSIPTWDSELYLEFHRGVYTTQAHHKANMRHAEEQVLNAEKWASLAWLDGRAYPGDELTEDWKKVLFNQFHDLAAGSGIGVIYKDAQKDYDVVRWSTDEIDTGALQTVVERIGTAGKAATGIPVVVFNPLGWTRSGAVTVKLQLPHAIPQESALTVIDPSHPAAHLANDVLSADASDGTVSLRIQVPDVPALGYKTVYVLPTPSHEAAAKVDVKDTADSITLENKQLRVTVSKSTGCITSLYDKTGSFETLAANSCGNELQAFKDNPKQYDAWNIDPGTYDVAPTLLHMVDSVTSSTSADGSAAIKVSRTWQSSKFVQSISLTATAAQVDVENDFDWHERHTLLKASFPLAATAPMATYEIPYGTIQRSTARDNSFEKAQFEVPAIRWADLGDAHQGMSLLNQTKYGYDAVGNQLRLTLLRSPVSPDPDADQGHQHFHYALYPHSGSWQDALTMRHGWEYDYQLTGVVTTAHAGSLPTEHSFASVTPDNVVLTAVKKAEDSKSLIFRAYEWAGKSSDAEFRVPPGATGATETNLMEKPDGSPIAVTGDTVKVPIHPYEILTLQVDYPTGGPKE